MRGQGVGSAWVTLDLALAKITVTAQTLTHVKAGATAGRARWGRQKLFGATHLSEVGERRRAEECGRVTQDPVGHCRVTNLHKNQQFMANACPWVAKMAVARAAAGGRAVPQSVPQDMEKVFVWLETQVLCQMSCHLFAFSIYFFIPLASRIGGTWVWQPLVARPCPCCPLPSSSCVLFVVSAVPESWPGLACLYLPLWHSYFIK